MSRQRIAIVGTGITGLACARFLGREHEITVFEKEPRLGGHAHTVEVVENGRLIPVDTGFMVYNEVTYPLLTRLFRELAVPTQPTSMSFSVQQLAAGLEFNGGPLTRFFGQRRNLSNIRFWRMLLQIARFNRETVEELAHPAFAAMTLRDYVAARGYGDDLLHWYLSPMASAVWSCPPEKIEEFPVRTLMRFWHNHGFLGLNTPHPWRTVSQGSGRYVTALSAPFEQHIRRDTGVRSVARLPGGRAGLTLEDGSREEFDRVVITAHGDQALRLLEDPTGPEAEWLACFRYQKNEAVLHADPSFMPATRRCWASWNYRVEPAPDGTLRHATHYWMNSLQAIAGPTPYFVSLNPATPPSPARVKWRLTYEHPLFDLASASAQTHLPQLRADGHHTGRFFCGAWQRHGFHEDGIWSATKVCRSILNRDPWL